MNRANTKKLYTVILIGFFVLAAVAFFVISLAYDSIRPIIFGVCIAYIFKPMCNVYYKWTYALFSRKLTIPKAKKFAHYVSIVLTYLTWTLIIYVFLCAVLPQIVKSVVNIVNNIPAMIGNITAFVTDLIQTNEVLLELVNRYSDQLIQYWYDNVDRILSYIPSFAGGVISGVISTVTFLFNLIVGFIVSVYVLGGRKKLGAQAKLIIKSVFSKRAAQVILNEVSFADRMFSKYFVGSIIDSTIVGVVCYVASLILGMPYAPLVAVIIGVTNLIPFFGPYIGTIPSALIIFTVSPVKALIFAVMMFIIQQIDGNILAPRIIGSNTGLSSFWVLFAILLFGGLFGFVGMIIGTPVFAVIYDVCGKLVRLCLRHRGEHEEIASYEKEFFFPDKECEGIFKKKLAEWKEEYARKRAKCKEDEKGNEEGTEPLPSENERGDQYVRCDAVEETDEISNDLVEEIK